MSSTTGVQNFLVNVFRPVYTFDPLEAVYVAKLELSNIDTYSGNSLSVFTAAVGDANNNVYVGSNAGNVYTNLRACSNVVALGVNAGSLISNVSNSTYLGTNAGNNATSANAVIGIGASVGGGGTSNVFIGNGTSATGSNNILIGHGITATNNTFRIGSTVYGNLSNNWIGIGSPSPQNPDNRLDVSGNTYVLGQVGINITPGDRTLDVNGDFRASDANGNTLDFNDGVTLSSGGLGSITGTLVSVSSGTTITIGTLKKGAILISAQDSASASHYASTMVYCINPASGAANVSLSSNVQLGEVSIVFSTSNIQISNSTTTRSIGYSITYFPLP